MAITESKNQRGQWYFVHVLAVLTAFTTVLFFWLQSNFDLTAMDPLAPPPIPPRIALITLVGTIAMFWFWFRMLAACVRTTRAARSGVGLDPGLGLHVRGAGVFPGRMASCPSPN